MPQISFKTFLNALRQNFPFFLFVFVSGVVFAFICSLLFSLSLIKEIQLKDKLHIEDLRQIAELRQNPGAPNQSQLERTDDGKTFVKQDRSLTHTITFSPRNKNSTIVTTDSESGEPAEESLALPYKRLIDFLNSTRIEYSDIVLASYAGRSYAVVLVNYGDVMVQFFEVSVDQYGENASVELFYSGAGSGRHALCGWSIFTYYPATAHLLASYGCGDGGAGGGTLKLISSKNVRVQRATEYSANSQVRNIQEYGIGLNTASDTGKTFTPRFLGFMDDKLYFGDIVEVHAGSDNSNDVVKIAKVFSINPLTMEKKYLPVDFSTRTLDQGYSNYKAQPHELVFSDSQNQFVSDRQSQTMYYLNIDTLQWRTQIEDFK